MVLLNYIFIHIKKIINKLTTIIVRTIMLMVKIRHKRGIYEIKNRGICRNV